MVRATLRAHARVLLTWCACTLCYGVASVPKCARVCLGGLVEAQKIKMRLPSEHWHLFTANAHGRLSRTATRGGGHDYMCRNDGYNYAFTGHSCECSPCVRTATTPPNIWPAQLCCARTRARFLSFSRSLFLSCFDVPPSFSPFLVSRHLTPSSHVRWL